MTLDLARALERHGASVELFSFWPTDDPVEPSSEVTYGSSGGARLRFALPALLIRLVRACRRADLVVCGSEVGLALPLGYAAARFARRPCAVIVHADLDAALAQWVPPRMQPLIRWVHRHVDAAVCVSPALVQGVVSNGLDRGRTEVITNGVDVERVRGLAQAASPLPPPSRPRVVGLGRLSGEKGYDLLVHAHAALCARNVDHELVVVGDGPDRQLLAELADRLGVSETVSFPGALANPYPVLVGASVFVLPSRREGVPLALLEALALGVPVIASRCADSVERILADGAFGELIEKNSVTALETALAAHLREPERLTRLARLGAANADQHDIDRVAGEYLAAFGRFARADGCAPRAARQVGAP
jgi:glycosyltransferase involved in cell wall biosynthesis